MKIAVIAASGRSGQVFVSAALDAGHTVIAGVHRSNPFAPHERLTSVSVDATNPLQVDGLIRGADAVVSLIGHIRGSAPRVQSEAITVVLDSMSRHGVTRIVSLTGTGVRQSGDCHNFIDWLANKAIAIVDPQRIQDGIEHARLLQQSGTDWTIMRVLKLSNGKAGAWSLRPSGPAKLLTPRQEVAQAILVTLESNTYLRASPVIADV